MPTETALKTRIWLDDRVVAWVDDTNTNVKEIVLDKMAHGWSPEEMHEQHPHLSLAHIHAALSYYYDHQEEIDAQIERDEQLVDELRRQAGESPIVRRLRAEGRLP